MAVVWPVIWPAEADGAPGVPIAHNDSCDSMHTLQHRASVASTRAPRPVCLCTLLIHHITCARACAWMLRMDCCACSRALICVLGRMQAVCNDESFGMTAALGRAQSASTAGMATATASNSACRCACTGSPTGNVACSCTRLCTHDRSHARTHARRLCPIGLGRRCALR